MFGLPIHAVPTGTGRGNWLPDTGVTYGFEQPCGCCELNWEPLEKQPVILTAEPSVRLYGFSSFVDMVYILGWLTFPFTLNAKFFSKKAI